MNNQYKHLPLPIRHQGRPKLSGGGSPDPRTLENKINRTIHGQKLRREVTNASEYWKLLRETRVTENLPNLSSGIPLLLQIDPSVDIDFLRTSLNLEIVSELEDGFIIVATEDIELAKFHEVLSGFLGGTHASFANVYGLSTDRNERLKQVLSDDLYEKWGLIENDGQYIVDISIECSGSTPIPKYPDRSNEESDDHFSNRLEAWNRRYAEAYQAWDELRMERERELERILHEYQGAVIDNFEDENSVFELPDCFTMRVAISGRALRDIAYNLSYVFEIMLPEEIDVGFSGDQVLPANGLQFEIDGPTNTSPVVCVIDSGIQEEHRLLTSAVLQEDSKCYLQDNSGVSDLVSDGGHGTRVASAMLYPLGFQMTGTYRLPFFIQNAKVLDAQCQMPDYLYPPAVTRRIVKDFYDNEQHRTRIFNHSIGSNGPCRLKHMSSWAAEIDNLSYEKDILFIQSSGNLKCQGSNQNPGIQDHLNSERNYPQYLLEDSCRISNPAQSLQAVTVGSICHTEADGDSSSIGRTDYPSSFSRSGKGIWGTIKPDVVEYGGDLAFYNVGGRAVVHPLSILGPELARTSPPGPAFDCDAVGTSFSAPKVAHIAAELAKVLPDSSTLLYRALIVQSARWPEILHAENMPIDERLRYYGYGVPSLQKAVENDEYRVTLITNNASEIGLTEAHVYQIPIPEEMRQIGDEYNIRVDITLSYAAKPRRTRRNIRNYLSTWVDWESSNIGEDPDVFVRRIFETGARINDGGGIPWTIGIRTDRGEAEGFRRASGTLQKDWAIVKSHQLRDGFCIAVRGRKGWNPALKAKYCLAVSFEAVDADVMIYESIRTLIETEVQTGEIEAEFEIELEE